MEIIPAMVIRIKWKWQGWNGIRKVGLMEINFGMEILLECYAYFNLLVIFWAKWLVWVRESDVNYHFQRTLTLQTLKLPRLCHRSYLRRCQCMFLPLLSTLANERTIDKGLNAGPKKSYVYWWASAGSFLLRYLAFLVLESCSCFGLALRISNYKLNVFWLT